MLPVRAFEAYGLPKIIDEPAKARWIRAIEDGARQNDDLASMQSLMEVVIPNVVWPNFVIVGRRLCASERMPFGMRVVEVWTAGDYVCVWCFSPR
jgi:hypothetical protein